MSKRRLKKSDILIGETPGTGKTFMKKKTFIDIFFSSKDDIIICDSDGEFCPLVNELGGQIIKITPSSPYHINPMDISPNYSEEVIMLKMDLILSFCGLIVGGKYGLYGLTPEERSIIELCTTKVYAEYFKNPVPENMPILEDLYNFLRGYAETGEAAQNVAISLEPYVKGSQNFFNHRTNVDISNRSNRLVCLDITELGESLRNLGILILKYLSADDFLLLY